jgi:hypothetical protein
MPTPRYLLRTLLILLCAAAARPASSIAQGAQQIDPSAAQHVHSSEDDRVVLFPPREASGTGWQPETTPMHSIHRRLGAWEVMFHGNVFVQLLYEPDERHRTGGFATTQFSSVNWMMAAARRPTAAGRVGVRATLSLEPWTVSDCGYLNFLASGEICEGDTIHDRQHPHDLFMEIAADYDRPLAGTRRWQLYAALAGEPALGPGGFPHRSSAMPNPVAPITHHWLDSTHLAFGVITGALYDRRWKAEVSVFNGREPDADRADVDLAALDSVAARISLMPTPRLTVQASAAHLTEAEEEFAPRPRSDVRRVTASATYHRDLRAGGIWATTAAYGLNSGHELVPEGEFDTATHAVLLETSASFAGRDTWFGRLEIAGKPAHDLHAHEFGASVFTVGKLQVGYTRHLPSWKGVTPGIGATVSGSLVPPALAPHYSGRFASGVGVFFNLRPASSPH